VDKLRAMAAFVEIVDRGSLTAAAEALERSQPTMVRTLATLERSLGVVLLRRTTRRMSLTEEGRVYLEQCRRILSAVQEAEELVGHDEGEPRGVVRVTAPVLFGQMHVMPLLVGFLRRYPEVKVELVLLDRVVDLVEEGFDVALRIGDLGDSSMIAIGVGDMRRVVCASPSLLAEAGDPGRPEELEGRACISFRGLGGGTWRFSRGKREFTVRVDGGFATNQISAALAACEAGLGFGYFLAYQVAPAIREGRLRVILREFERPALSVSLLYRDARLASRRLRALLDWLGPRLRQRIASL